MATSGHLLPSHRAPSILHPRASTTLSIPWCWKHPVVLEASSGTQSIPWCQEYLMVPRGTPWCWEHPVVHRAPRRAQGSTRCPGSAQPRVPQHAGRTQCRDLAVGSHLIQQPQWGPPCSQRPGQLRCHGQRVQEARVIIPPPSFALRGRSLSTNLL